jgi:hypothetical protein
MHRVNFIFCFFEKVFEAFVGFEHSFDIYFSHNFHDVIDGALHMRQREERMRRGGGRGGFWFMFAGLVEERE